MRPAWNGHISFGLISIPISLYSAVEASEHVSFRMLHRKDKAPIRYKKFCSLEDKEVPNDEIVKGYEVDDGEYAEIEKEELDKVEEEASGGTDGEMEVLQFVDFGAVNPLSFDSPYYAAPRKGGEKAYAVLREALREANQVGIARFAMRDRPRLATLIPGPQAIAVETLRPFEEMRSPSKLSIPSPPKKSAEVKMARMLIDQMASEGWDPAEHPDTYRKALKKLLSSRRRFRLQEAAPAARGAKGGEVVDLMAALKKSLQSGGRTRKPGARRAGAA